MSRKLKVVAVSGSLQRPSRTLVLVDQLLAALGEQIAIESRVISLGDIGPQFAGVLYRNQLPAAVEESIAAIESADLLLVASPVYRGSYTGLFKHLFDFVHHEALTDKPVLLAATGGSDRHALVIDHQLRPLFSFFQALTLPIGVYAVEKDFEGYEIASPALRDRIALAVARAVPQLRDALPATASTPQPTPANAPAVRKPAPVALAA
ncbi:FMN reductase [Variovorax atrisoli]|uniref:FMN reductase n=1 Tax=Variovorax atrisoli TaxID=3394203 RepID=UPI000F7D634A|nr:FMN reductase [Variovorax sp. 369]RTD86574.1 FMN reductase [Variovorax sp. 369]